MSNNHEFDSSRTCNYCGFSSESIHELTGLIPENVECPDRKQRHEKEQRGQRDASQRNNATKCHDAARLLDLASHIREISFYEFTSDRNRPTKLCIRRVDGEVYPMSQAEAERFAIELNEAIFPVLEKWAEMYIERAREQLGKQTA